MDQREPTDELRRELVEAGVLVWRVRLAGGDLVVAGAGRLRLVNVSFVPLELAEAVRARRDDVLCYLGASPSEDRAPEPAADEETALEMLLEAFPGATFVDEEGDRPA
ncbi:MAG: hypothetical protein ACYCTE_16905 [Acidimicrobiales bacterium]